MNNPLKWRNRLRAAAGQMAHRWRRPRIPVVHIGVLAVACLVAGLAVQVVLPTPHLNIKKGGTSYLYRQYNPDSPLFLRSTLAFPDYYHRNADRSSRPLFSLLLFPFARSVHGVICVLAPHSRAATLMWGPWPAVAHMSVYAGWLGLNTLLLAVLLYCIVWITGGYLTPKVVKRVLLFAVVSPPVLLCVPWLHTMVAGWALVGISGVIIFRLVRGYTPWGWSLAAGLLLLAKTDILFLVTGTLLLFTWESWRRWCGVWTLVLLPTLLWRLFCLQAGIDATPFEFGFAWERFRSAAPLGWLHFLYTYCVENVIGSLLLFSPPMLFAAGRALAGIGRSPLGGFMVFCAAVQASALFFLGRTGALYLYGYLFVWVPALAAVCQESARRTEKAAMQRWLLGVTVIWLPVALYAQLLLWRGGLWF